MSRARRKKSVIGEEKGAVGMHTPVAVPVPVLAESESSHVSGACEVGQITSLLSVAQAVTSDEAPRSDKAEEDQMRPKSRRPLFLSDVCYLDPAYRNQFSSRAAKTLSNNGSLRGTNVVTFHNGNMYSDASSSSISDKVESEGIARSDGSRLLQSPRRAQLPSAHPTVVAKKAAAILKNCAAESKQMITSILVTNREKGLVYHQALSVYQAASPIAGGGGGTQEDEDAQWEAWLKPVAEPFMMKVQQSDASKLDLVRRKECRLRDGPRDPASWLHLSFRDAMRQCEGDMLSDHPWNGGDAIDERDRKVRVRCTENKYIGNFRVSATWKGSWNFNLSGGCFKIKTKLLNMDRFCEVRTQTRLSGTSTSASTLAESCTGADGGVRKVPTGGLYFHRVDGVFPTYIPIIVPLPKSRAWCSLMSNVASDDQLELRVNPYLGEDDGAYKELYFEGYDAIPDHFEGEIVELAAVQTVKLLLQEYQSLMTREDFGSLAVALGEYSRRVEEEAEGTDGESLQQTYRRMSNHIVSGLCKVLPVTENQARRLARRLCDEASTTPSMMRKAIFHFDRKLRIGALENPANAFLESPSCGSALTLNSCDPSFAKHRPESTDWTEFGTYPLLTIPNSLELQRPNAADPEVAGSTARISNHSSSTNSKGFVSASEIWSSFEDNLSRMSQEGQLDLQDTTDLNKAFGVVADSFQLLFCRRCFIFDCPVHKVLLPPPHDRIDPPPPGLCPVTGLELPTDFIRRPHLRPNRKQGGRKTSHNEDDENESSDSDSYVAPRSNRIDKFAAVPFGLYAEPNGENSSQMQTDLSFVEAVLSYKLLEAFDFNPESINDVAHCIGTREPTDINRFLKRYQPSIFEPANSSVDTSEDLSAQPSLCKPCVSYKKETKYSLKRKINKKSAINLPAPVYDYEPCNHPGACSTKNGCRCKALGVNCEKYCGCSIAECGLRYEGCKCSISNSTGCCNSKMCPCFAAGRECDPEMCRSCGSSIHPSLLTDVKAHIAKMPEDQKEQLCCNVGLRRGDRKRLGVARSDIQGWGLFILEKAAKNDLILEYTGEVISHNEAERRGVLYDRFGCSYLFNLNKESVVDSTRMGNIAKFVNHNDRNDRNCYPCIKVVDGTHRIGLYAKRPIEAGEELTFDYQYTKETAPAWAEPRTNKKIKRSKTPSKKQPEK